MMPVQDRHKEALEALIPQWDIQYTKPKSVTEEMLLDADIIFGNVPPASLHKSNRLEWLQLNSAGADVYIPKGVLPQNTLLTNATGAYGLAVSEHMIAMTMALFKNLHLYGHNQRDRKWKVEGKVKSFYNANVLVMGLGDIGGEYARKAHAMGARVTGIKRNLRNKPEYVEGVYTMDGLEELLPGMDVVAMILPASPETYHIMNEKTLALMKPNAVLINAGRGNAVDCEALCRFLNQNPSFSAGLDVTEPEPLPADHPLWDCKNLLLTPHSAGNFLLDETFERIWRIVLENLKAYLKGEALRNPVQRG